MTKEKKSDEGLKYSNKVIIIASIVFIASVILYAHQFGLGLWETPEQWGALGDFFGGILNPLLAFSSLVLLLETLRQNHKALNQNEKALNINNEELKLTRDELTASKRALQKQAQVQDKQSFENTFFNLLRMHQDLLNSIDLVSKEHGRTNGRDCFKIFYRRLEKIIIDDDDTGDFQVLMTPIHSKRDFISRKYMDFYKDTQSEIGHYFRSLYNVVKFVDESNVDNKQLYMNILRAQLSTYELLLLFYNCLSDVGVNKFKNLVEEYSLLKGIPEQFLTGKAIEKHLYKKTAFSNQNITDKKDIYGHLPNYKHFLIKFQSV